MEIKLNIQDIQYMNLFSMITRVIASDCFSYNSNVIFVVKPGMLSKAVGMNGENVKRLSEKIMKRVKIVRSPNMEEQGNKKIERFILSITHPVKFKRLINKNGELIIFAGGPQSKAQLLGRESVKLIELRGILKKYFNIKTLRVS